MSEERFEHCYLCDELTGRAGRADDSIFVEAMQDVKIGSFSRKDGEEIGPLCSECFDALEQLGIASD